MTAGSPFQLLQGGRRTAADRRVLAPAPDQPPPPSRAATRHLAGEFAAMLLLLPIEAGVGKAAELDGELLACCGDAVAADHAADRAMDGADTIPWNDPAMDHVLAAALPFLDAYEAAVDRAAQIPARTPEGLRAKASLLLHVISAGLDCERLAGSLGRDVAGRAP